MNAFFDESSQFLDWLMAKKKKKINPYFVLKLHSDFALLSRLNYKN
jgi:hypothetical protein